MNSVGLDCDFDFLKIKRSDATEVKRFLLHQNVFCDRIPNDAFKTNFPYRLLHKMLQNGESVRRDWIWWSGQSTAVFCAPCLLDGQSSNNFTKGWNIERGWRKLKDRIPSHEATSIHKINYIKWMDAIKLANCHNSIDNVLCKQIQSECNKMILVLERILSVIVAANKKIGIIAGVGDRRDEDIRECAKIAGRMFDHIIIRQEKHLRGTQKTKSLG